MGLSRSALTSPRRIGRRRTRPSSRRSTRCLRSAHAGGCRKCFERLHQDGCGWNHKRVYRVYCAMRLNLQRKVRRLVTRERQPLLASNELNRVWALDFMRDTLYDGRPFRTLNVIDEGNREALRIECGTSIPSARVVRVLNQLVEVYGRPEAIRLDNGPELTADAFVDWAKDNGVKLLFIQPGKPNQNAFIERFNRSFRQEVLVAWLFNAVSEVQDAADAWLTDYNEYRPHDSLGNMPPALFRPRVFNQEVSTSELST
ncbi:MAG: IS3 family transposase [Thiomonas delicata]